LILRSATRSYRVKNTRNLKRIRRNRGKKRRRRKEKRKKSKKNNRVSNLYRKSRQNWLMELQSKALRSK
jgi:hypothetical protein